MSIGRSVTGLLMLAVGLAGCTAGNPVAAPPPSVSAGTPPHGGPSDGTSAGAGPITADCAGAIDHEAEPPAGYRVVGGAVAVPPEDRMLEISEHAAEEGPTRFFAKWGLLVRAGATVRLSLAPEWAERARLHWGDTAADPAVTFQVTGCPPGAAAGAWTVFAGGTFVAEADCVPIRVEAGRQQEVVEMSVGTSCSRPGG